MRRTIERRANGIETTLGTTQGLEAMFFLSRHRPATMEAGVRPTRLAWAVVLTLLLTAVTQPLLTGLHPTPTPERLDPGATVTFTDEPSEDEGDGDGDGYSNATETACGSDPTNATSVPMDLDDDGICNALDDDMDGDGVVNAFETGSPDGSEPDLVDTDGDGVCDGFTAIASANCTAGPDAFPADPSAVLDTDGDGFPDALNGASTSQPMLVEDLDDDGDTWTDYDESVCGTNSSDPNDHPLDTDGDGTCDGLDDVLDLPISLTYAVQHVDLLVNVTVSDVMANLSGDGDVETWELEGELPEGLSFRSTLRNGNNADGSFYGTPTSVTNETHLVRVWANNSVYQRSAPLAFMVYADADNDSLPDTLPTGYLGNLSLDLDDDDDGFADAMEVACGSDPLNNSSGPLNDTRSVCLDLFAEPPRDEGVNWIWCFPALMVLLGVLLVPIMIGRRFVDLLNEEEDPEETNDGSESVTDEDEDAPPDTDELVLSEA